MLSLVAVPAIGADPEKTWADEKSGEPWLISESRKKLGNSRVIFFDHGAPDDQDDLETLAQHLLIHLRRKRNADVGCLDTFPIERKLTVVLEFPTAHLLHLS